MSLVQPLVQTPVPSPDAGGLSGVVQHPRSPVFLGVGQVAPRNDVGGLVHGIFGDPVFADAQVIFRTLTDGMGLADPAERTATNRATISDGIGTRDADQQGLDSADAYRRTLSEGESLSDAQRQVLEAFRTQLDSLGTTDALAKTQRTSLAEAMGLADPMTFLYAQTRTVTDSMGLADTAARVQEARQRLTESVGASDPAEGVDQAYRAALEALGLSDAHLREQRKAVFSPLGITDSLRQALSSQRVVLDGLAVDDVESALGDERYSRVLIEPLGLSDPVTYRLILPGRFRYDRLRPVYPGKGYVASVYVRHEGTPFLAFAEVTFYDAAMTRLETVSSQPVQVTDVPKRVVCRALAPAGAAWARIQYGKAGVTVDGVTARWDAAQWELGEVETTYGPKPDEILPSAVQSTMLALGAVTTDRVAAGAITNSLVAVGAIDARTLGPQAVTNAKMAPGSVNTEQLVVGSVVTGAIAAGAITAETIAANAVQAEKIAAGAVVADKIGAGAIVAGKIAAGAVAANEIAAGAIVAGKIAAGAVATNELAAGAITAGKIAADAVTANSIAAGAITATKVAADAIVAGKIAADAIATRELAANAVIAENILAGSVSTAQLAAGAVVAEKISAGSIVADKIATNAIEAKHVAANVITTGHIVAGAIDSDRITSTGTIAGKTLVGGSFSTAYSGNDRITLQGAAGLLDALRWYTSGNGIAAELRGIMGDVQAYGLYLNSHAQLGNGQSILYQVGRRHGSFSASKVRAGYASVGLSNGVGSITLNMPTAPTTVQVTPVGRACMVRVYNVSASGFSMEFRAPGATGGDGPVGNTSMDVYYYAEAFA